MRKGLSLDVCAGIQGRKTIFPDSKEKIIGRKMKDYSSL